MGDDCFPIFPSRPQAHVDTKERPLFCDLLKDGCDPCRPLNRELVSFYFIRPFRRSVQIYQVDIGGKV